MGHFVVSCYVWVISRYILLKQDFFAENWMFGYCSYSLFESAESFVNLGLCYILFKRTVIIFSSYFIISRKSLIETNYKILYLSYIILYKLYHWVLFFVTQIFEREGGFMSRIFFFLSLSELNTNDSVLVFPRNNRFYGPGVFNIL